MRVIGIIASVVVAAIAIGGGVFWYVLGRTTLEDPFLPVYAEHCAVCHGDDMRGSAQGPALVGRALAHGDTVDALAASIGHGYPGLGMPAWSQTMEDSEVRSLAILIAEKRVDRDFTQFRMDAPVALPAGVISTQRASFRFESVAQGIASYPFSIAALPDGRILVTEKQFGLSIVSPDGTRTQPLEGAPAVSNVGLNVSGLEMGLGWHLDVAPHPDYVHNGWIYLQHTHVCEDCGSSLPVTMNRVVRGHIKGHRWVDEQVIWSVPRKFYTSQPDIGAGGRLAFDDRGHLFISVGIKGGYYEGVQDLATPYGKVHRVFDDGRIPDDNPYVHTAGAMASIWTVGHRSPQGLEFDRHTHLLWESEMGPRGGDEINLLLPGHNYGWPLRSLGVDYDGTPVEYGKDLGIDAAKVAIDRPIADFTPSPALGSFVIYEGAAFPGWNGDFLVTSLRAGTLYRVHIEHGRHTGTEVLAKGLSRIRDITVAPDGTVLLLLEHKAGSRIVRLVPGTTAGNVRV